MKDYQYVDHDPAIRIELTGDESPYCLRLFLGETTIVMHVRSAVDLVQKLHKATLDWTQARLVEVAEAAMQTGVPVEFGK